MVPITQSFEPDGRRPADDSTPDTEIEEASWQEVEPLLCWICRQPLARTRCVRWRDEPIHPHCR